MELHGKVAIVTGAAQAIGYATAWELAKAGAAVTLADIQQKRGAEAAAALQSDGRAALFVETDVGNPKHLKHMVDRTVEKFGRVDILVNNAAILDMRGSVTDETPERWNEGLAVNVRGVALGTKFAAVEMRKTGGGAIVNVASVHGYLSAERHAIYDTCKHAVIGLTRQSAVDLGVSNIRVNAICPGAIVSELTEETWMANEERAALTEAVYPLRRVGRPHDIAAAVRFLVSDEAAFITGVALPVDGGLTIQLADSVSLSVEATLKSNKPTGKPNTPAMREYP